MMDGKVQPPTPTDMLPRGDLDEHTVPEGHRVTRTNVELAGELWDIEFDYLTLSQYTSHVSTVSDPTDPLEMRMAIAKSMKPSLNGKEVDWDSIAPNLGIRLAKYLDMQLNLSPSKNY